MEATGAQSALTPLRSMGKWPAFILHWTRLQKLDLTAEEIGGASQRLGLAVLAHIPIVRLKSNRGMALRVPKQAAWKHLSLECALVMFLEFEDINTFGKARSPSCASARRLLCQAEQGLWGRFRAAGYVHRQHCVPGCLSICVGT